MKDQSHSRFYLLYISEIYDLQRRTHEFVLPGAASATSRALPSRRRGLHEFHRPKAGWPGFSRPEGPVLWFYIKGRAFYFHARHRPESRVPDSRTAWSFEDSCQFKAAKNTTWCDLWQLVTLMGGKNKKAALSNFLRRTSPNPQFLLPDVDIHIHQKAPFHSERALFFNHFHCTLCLKKSR